MKLIIYLVGVLLLGIITVQCYQTVHIPLQEDCTYQNGNPDSKYHIWMNATHFPGHKISLKIEADNFTKSIDHQDVLLNVNDLELISDVDIYQNFKTADVGNFWICTRVLVEKGFKKTLRPTIDWRVQPGHVGK